MSSESVSIRVDGVSKCFELYATPRDRLKQFLVPRFQRMAGLEPKQYFREFWALKDISFEVRKGEAVGIVGRNGSGKSTLLQIITGTLSPTSGTVSTQGRVAALLELGSGFNPEFSGRENVYLNGALLGMARGQIDAKFDAIAAFADIGQHLDHPVKTYSSGMLVRLAFAVQVQLDPDILIVDEALAVGDALFQKRCIRKIERLVSKGTTLLFVSHNQEFVRTLTHRALLLQRGVAAEWGLSPEVLLQYRRLLHEEESSYFDAAVKDVSARSRAAAQFRISAEAPGSSAGSPGDSHAGPVSGRQESRLDRRSFGDGDVRIVRVATLDSEGKPCSVYYTGDRLRILVVCRSEVDIDRLNVAVRLRNKEGVKIYSWGTLNQDISVTRNNRNAPVFWNRRVKVGETFEVLLECICSLGVNLYEVQAAVSFEETPDYSSQRMLQWVDEAAFFQVLMKNDDYFFGGAVDLKMTATW